MRLYHFFRLATEIIYVARYTRRYPRRPRLSKRKMKKLVRRRRQSMIRSQEQYWNERRAMDFYSYKVGTGEDCEFTGYVHIISPGLHTVLFYNDGVPEVTAHQRTSGTVEVSAWAPYYNSFKTATIVKGK